MNELQHPSVTEDMATPTGLSSRRSGLRLLIFALLCTAALGVAGGSVIVAMRRTGGTGEAGDALVAAPETLSAIQARPHLLFLQTDGDADRQVALAPLDAPEEGAWLTSLRCQRVYFAGGRGLCLGRDQFGGGAAVFDAGFQIVHTLPSNGIPSRTRVSPDGRYGTMTVFVQGHSYAEGGFSTSTTLVDMASGRLIGDLEEFTVLRDGARVRVPDFNFWGVTFAGDSNRFYATLATGGKTYLVEGDIAARTVRTLRENVECPSLSPDNTRVAFKKRMPNDGGRVRWQAHVLNLATMTETPLAETRNVDDQIEWLDDNTVMFSLPDEGPPATIRPDLWTVPADGSGKPQRLTTRSLSPAVVRSGT
jgi:hypothetical protein